MVNFMSSPPAELQSPLLKSFWRQFRLYIWKPDVMYENLC